MNTFGTKTRQSVPVVNTFGTKTRQSVLVVNTFGTKTRQSVPVVQKMMKTEMMMKEAFFNTNFVKNIFRRSIHSRSCGLVNLFGLL